MEIGILDGTILVLVGASLIRLEVLRKKLNSIEAMLQRGNEDNTSE